MALRRGAGWALRGEAGFRSGDQALSGARLGSATRYGGLSPIGFPSRKPRRASMTALAAEVLHVRIDRGPAAPCFGTAPLKRAVSGRPVEYCRKRAG